jgi:hypothetical protein
VFDNRIKNNNKKTNKNITEFFFIKGDTKTGSMTGAGDSFVFCLFGMNKFSPLPLIYM